MQIPSNPYIKQLNIQFLTCFHESIHCIATNNLLKCLISNKLIPTNQQNCIQNIQCRFKDLIFDFFSDKNYDKLYSIDFSNQNLPQDLLCIDNNLKLNNQNEDELIWATDTSFRIKKIDVMQGLTILFDFKFENRVHTDISRKDTSIGSLMSIIKKNLQQIQVPLCHQYIQNKNRQKQLALFAAQRLEKQKAMRQRKRKDKNFRLNSRTTSRTASTKNIVKNCENYHKMMQRKKFGEIQKQKQIQEMAMDEKKDAIFCFHPCINRNTIKKNIEKRSRMDAFCEQYSNLQSNPQITSELSLNLQSINNITSRCGSKMIEIDSQNIRCISSINRKLKTIESSQSNYNQNTQIILFNQKQYQLGQTLKLIKKIEKITHKNRINDRNLSNNYLHANQQKFKNIMKTQQNKLIANLNKQKDWIPSRTHKFPSKINKLYKKQNLNNTMTINLSKMNQQGQWKMRKTHRIVINHI